jgi:hypothetical protein
MYFAESSDDSEHAKLLGLVKSLTVPGFVVVRDEGVDSDSRAYFAVLRQGPPLARVVGRRGLPELRDALRWGCEAAAILAAVAQGGVQLPDADPWRFEVDADGRLWLADLRGATPSDPKLARSAHLGQLRALCDVLIAKKSSFLPPPGLLDQLARVPTLADAHRLLAACAG